MTTVQAKHRKRRIWLTQARYRVIAVGVSYSSLLFFGGLVVGIKIR